MKKTKNFKAFILTILLITTLGIFISNISGKETSNKKTDKGEKKMTTETTKKVLITYFSHSGNTRTVAEQIKEITGGDIFEIKPVKNYPEEYQAVLEQSTKEIKAGFRPEIKNNPKNIEEYDVVFVGTPNWLSTIAPPVATFLTSCNFKGKIIAPFITHGGGGKGKSEADIKKLCPDATILEELGIPGNRVSNSKKDVEKWIKTLNL